MPSFLRTSVILLAFVAPIALAQPNARPAAPNTYSCTDCYGPRPTACWTESQAAGAPAVNSDFNSTFTAELNAYAAAYLDAHRPGCRVAARDFLDAKLAATLSTFGDSSGVLATVYDRRQNKSNVHPFNAWLAGAMVTHIFAAARGLGEAGITVNDTNLQRIRDTYFGSRSPQDYSTTDAISNCGLASMPFVNSCMDDFALAASGFGWIAAYEQFMGRLGMEPERYNPYVKRAKAEMARALLPMETQTGAETGGGPCIVALKSPYTDPLDYVTDPAINCDAGIGNVPDTARVIGADHDQENPGYGVGLMTAIGSGCAGLYFAGTPCAFSDQQKSIALGLLQHAQRRTPQDGQFCDFTGGCINFVTLGQVSCSDADLDNADGGYRPKDFPVALFYEKRAITGALSAPYYQFDQYCENRTDVGSVSFWGANRKAFYQILGNQIFSDSPTLTSISKPCASTVGGLGLTVNGTGFLADLYVGLVGTEVSTLTAANTVISLTAPSRPHASHVTGDVLVINPGLRSATLTGAFTWALRADANDNGALTGADAFYLQQHIFSGGPAPATLCNGDANSNGAITGADSFFLNQYIFVGGPPPGP